MQPISNGNRHNILLIFGVKNIAKLKPLQKNRASHRAWQTTKTLPIESFRSQPYLKTSGIAILLAEVLENTDGDDKKLEAYDVYVEALKQLQDANIPTLSGPEKMRAVALAYKLGELGGALEKPKEAQEKWLTFGVETVLKYVLEVPRVVAAATAGTEASASASAPVAVPAAAPPVAEPVQTTPSEEADNMLIIGELGLPDWVSTVDVAAPLEALGTFYSRAGKLE